MKTASETVVEKITKEKLAFVELWFVDILGRLHSVGIPGYAITEQQLRDGFDKLDSSSIMGFGTVDESDVSLLADAGTFRILPSDYDSKNRKNARMFADIVQRDPQSNSAQAYDRDSRSICKKAMVEITKFGLEKAFWGPEVEFFVFDVVNNKPSPAEGCYKTNMIRDAFESELSTFNERNAARHLKSGYYQAQPLDSLNGLRKDVCDDLYRHFGIKVEAQHHEVATMGQCEINIHYGDTLEAADSVVTIKSLAKVKAERKNKIATFMPKPIFGDNASALHMHQSLWTKDGRNAMHDPDEKKSGLSQLARYYVGGILDHASSLCAISNPTTNSYKRLVPGYEAPVYACWGIGNRSAAVRVPRSDMNNERRKRIEYRVPDSSANIYLLESALIMAGLDGIRRKLDPGDPVEGDVCKMTDAQRRDLKIMPLPASLKDSLDHLKSDRMFLNGVFSGGLLDSYMSIKYSEHDEFSQMPTSWEIFKYSEL
ncbi:MAG TPA: type I glutamate--ammonia ligase [Candidatus Nitrosotalea sp.]|nr:type I glutamate--ammonia ligase [Candidatus Nitrosotalea sp.]